MSSNVTLTFDDAAANSLPNNAQIVSGTFKPTNSGVSDTFPAPAPAGPYGSIDIIGNNEKQINLVNVKVYRVKRKAERVSSRDRLD